MYKLLDTNHFGYYFRLTNTNKFSIIVIVKKKKSIISNGVGAPTQIDFFDIHTHKFVVQNGLEFETQQIAVT